MTESLRTGTCGHILSQYNSGPLCFPCADRLALENDQYITWSMAQRLYGVALEQIRASVDANTIRRHGTMLLLDDVERLAQTLNQDRIPKVDETRKGPRQRTECARGHALVEPNILHCADGRRRCRACHNARKARDVRARRAQRALRRNESQRGAMARLAEVAA